MKRKYHAVIDVCLVPKCVYVVRLKFGPETIIFDPKDGRKPSVRCLDKVVEYIRKRKESILDFDMVLFQFVSAGLTMLGNLEQGGRVFVPKYEIDLNITPKPAIKTRLYPPAKL